MGIKKWTGLLCAVMLAATGCAQLARESLEDAQRNDSDKGTEQSTESESAQGLQSEEATGAVESDGSSAGESTGSDVTSGTLVVGSDDQAAGESGDTESEKADPPSAPAATSPTSTGSSTAKATDAGSNASDATSHRSSDDKGKSHSKSSGGSNKVLVVVPPTAPVTASTTAQAPAPAAPSDKSASTTVPAPAAAPTTATTAKKEVVTTSPTTSSPTTKAPTTKPPTTSSPTTKAPTTKPPTTSSPTTAAPRQQPTGSVLFSEDFTGSGAMSRFQTGLYHRDDSMIGQSQWMGDHSITGPNDLCGPPTEKRVIKRGNRSSGFNNDWIYRCVPGGDLGKAHVMTSIGDTSGYSIGAFSPTQSFSNVREVRWDVNQTDLGDRQWTEVAIIPASKFNMQNLPCTTDVPCATTTHDQLGSVGTQWGGLRARKINTPQQPGGYLEAGGSPGYRCSGCPYAPSRKFGENYGAGDPALTSLMIRRENFFRDNGNGTLTWGFQLDNGSFEEFTVPGSFPTGPVRVVFKDHNYTPLKSPATLMPTTHFTWHWDNIVILQ